MSAHSEPGSAGVPAWLYDGRSATRHEVEVHIEDRVVLIEDQPPVAIDLLARSDIGKTVFGRKDIPGWRLGFDHGLPPALEAAMPKPSRYGAWIDRFGLWRAAIACVLVSALVLTGAFYGLDLVARLIPFSWERRLGETMTGDFGNAACIEPDGQRALDDLARRLSPAGQPMRVRVIDAPIVNAVALPGGQILIFSGLIDEARSPDEIAGVLAHEIGHVVHRHVMMSLLRRFGVGLLLNAGGRPGEYAQSLIDARYSRAAESEADSYSLDHLVALHISPAATAALFARLGREESNEPQILTYLASHPPSKEREQLFAARNATLRDPRPALDSAAWAAVRSICTIRRAKAPDKTAEFRF